MSDSTGFEHIGFKIEFPKGRRHLAYSEQGQTKAENGMRDRVVNTLHAAYPGCKAHIDFVTEPKGLDISGTDPRIDLDTLKANLDTLFAQADDEMYGKNKEENGDGTALVVKFEILEHNGLETRNVGRDDLANNATEDPIYTVKVMGVGKPLVEQLKPRRWVQTFDTLQFTRVKASEALTELEWLVKNGVIEGY